MKAKGGRGAALVLAGLSACMGQDRVELSIVNAAALCVREGDTRWILSGKKPVAFVGNEAGCRFTEVLAGGRNRLVSTATLTWSGLPRFEVETSSKAGPSQILAVCGGRTGRFPVFRLPASSPVEIDRSRVICGYGGWGELQRWYKEGTSLYRAGRYLEASEAWAKEAERAEALGWTGHDAARFALAGHMAARGGDFRRARTLLKRAKERCPARPNLLRAWIERVHGHLAMDVGQFARAIEHYHQARRFAEEVGSTRDVAAEEIGLASALTDAGRDRRALELFERLLRILDARERAGRQIRSNYARALALAFLRGHPEVTEAQVRGAFRDAFQQYRALGASAARLSWVACEAASFELSLGQVEAAGAWIRRTTHPRAMEESHEIVRLTVETLDSVHGLPPERRLKAISRRRVEAERVWGPESAKAASLSLLEGRQAWENRQYERALAPLRRGLDALRARARGAQVRGQLWSAFFDQAGAVALTADALFRRGREESALTEVEAHFLETNIRLLALAQLPSGSPAWDHFASLRVQLRAAEAVPCALMAPEPRVACWSKQRGLRRSLEKTRRDLFLRSRDSIVLPAVSARDIVRSLAPGEVLLYGLKLGSGPGSPRWSLAVSDQGVLGVAIGQDLESTWRRRLRGVNRIFLVGALAPEPFFVEQRAPAAFAISTIPSGAQLNRQPIRTHGTLLVADPDGTLPQIRREAIRLHPQARVLVGPRQTHPRAVLAAMGRVANIHFVGHGVQSPTTDWSAHLLLSQGILTWEDILRAPMGPRVVILEGCKTGRGRAGGIPHAFLYHGTWAVMATTRVLRPGEGTPFVRRFLEAGGWAQPGRAFALAKMRSIAEGDASHLAFRLWGPLEPISPAYRGSTNTSNGSPPNSPGRVSVTSSATP